MILMDSSGVICKQFDEIILKGDSWACVNPQLKMGDTSRDKWVWFLNSVADNLESISTGLKFFYINSIFIIIAFAFIVCLLASINEKLRKDKS